MNLSAVDLNLLVALGALLRDRSVSVAARRVGLSQPAMSHALGRLRVMFDDPLLVRRGSKMHPTARGGALAERLNLCLDEIGALISERPRFEPVSSTRQFRIASEDYFGHVLLPELLRLAWAEAPGVDLDVRPIPPDAERELADGRLDLVIEAGSRASPNLNHTTLYREQHACLVDPAHHKRRLTLKQYAAAPHVIIGLGKPGPTHADRVLAKHGLQRRVALRVGQFLAGAFAVKGTALIYACPRRFAERLASVVELRVVGLPKEVEAAYPYAMFWDAHADTDPGHAWLRAKVELAARDCAARDR
ncbi:MAG: LysR family transcriptional regulator [Nannocystaceae bacterium]|nr:LysR family transcriptional regulator [Nannocystaceae bacterium]